MKIFLISVLLMLAAASGLAQTADLFISEYVEGSSYNKALEIFNGTAGAIELSTYQLMCYSNGTTEPSVIFFNPRILEPDEAYILVNEFAESALKNMADQTTSELNFNGDDSLVLMRGNLVVDSFGQVGMDPGDSWGCNSGTTINQTLRRVPSICSGDTVIDNLFNPCMEYDFLSQDTFDGLGQHSTDCFAVSNGHIMWDGVKARYR